MDMKNWFVYLEIFLEFRWMNCTTSSPWYTSSRTFLHKLRLQPTLHSWYWHLVHEPIAHANFYVNDATIDYVVCIEWSFYSEVILYNFFAFETVLPVLLVHIILLVYSERKWKFFNNGYSMSSGLFLFAEFC